MAPLTCTSVGQEASAVGVIRALSSNDQISRITAVADSPTMAEIQTRAMASVT
jgi:hypothetical protein